MRRFYAGGVGALLGAAVFAAWWLVNSLSSWGSSEYRRGSTENLSGSRFLGEGPAEPLNRSQRFEQMLGPRNSAYFRIAMVRLLAGDDEGALATVRNVPPGADRDGCLTALADWLLPNPDFESAPEVGEGIAPGQSDEQLLGVVDDLIKISNEFSDNGLRVRHATRAARLLLRLEKSKSKALEKQTLSSQSLLRDADAIAAKIDVKDPETNGPLGSFEHQAALLGGCLFAAIGGGLALVISSFGREIADSIGKTIGDGATKWLTGLMIGSASAISAKTPASEPAAAPKPLESGVCAPGST
jgi:hypothetical protein